MEIVFFVGVLHVHMRFFQFATRLLQIFEEVMDYRTYCGAIAKTYCWAIAISR